MSVAVNSLIPITEWLETVLGTDSTLKTLAPGGVWEGRLPEQAPGVAELFPGIVFAVTSALPYGAVGVSPFMVDAVVTVQAIDQSDSYAGADAAFNRILALLDRGMGTVTSGSVYSAQQEGQGIRYDDVVAGGVPFRHSGGTFRIYAH